MITDFHAPVLVNCIEPRYIQSVLFTSPLGHIANEALTRAGTWQTIDLSTMIFPAEMRVDYVRVYQRSGATNVGCDPPNFPTADYINNHHDAYNSTWNTRIVKNCYLCRESDPNFTYWSDTKPGLGLGAGYPWPKNSLVSCIVSLCL